MTTIEDRFWSHVQKTGNEGCWVWIANKNNMGYGLFGLSNGKSRLAHRIAFEMTNGPIPTGMQIDHKCHTPECVNPDHLRVATPAQNQYNRVRKTNTKSNLKGAFWIPKSGKWSSSIRKGSVTYRLGTFDTPLEAHEAYCRAAVELFGEFAYSGEIPHEADKMARMELKKAKEAARAGFMSDIQSVLDKWRAEVKGTYCGAVTFTVFSPQCCPSGDSKNPMTDFEIYHMKAKPDNPTL